MFRLTLTIACALMISGISATASAAAAVAPKNPNKRELAAIRSQDPNIPGTASWRKQKLADGTCKLSRHQGGRHDMTVAQQGAGGSKSSSAGDQSVR